VPPAHILPTMGLPETRRDTAVRPLVPTTVRNLAVAVSASASPAAHAFLRPDRRPQPNLTPTSGVGVLLAACVVFLPALIVQGLAARPRGSAEGVGVLNVHGLQGVRVEAEESQDRRRDLRGLDRVAVRPAVVMGGKVAL
jgi:hypothetical protein